MHRNFESKFTIASSLHDLQGFTPDPDHKEKKHLKEIYVVFDLGLSKGVYETQVAEDLPPEGGGLAEYRLHASGV